VFYLTGRHGTKIDAPARVAALKARLLEAAHPPVAAEASRVAA
jgi:hypothetical protein